MLAEIVWPAQTRIVQEPEHRHLPRRGVIPDRAAVFPADQAEGVLASDPLVFPRTARVVECPLNLKAASTVLIYEVSVITLRISNDAVATLFGS